MIWFSVGLGVATIALLVVLVVLRRPESAGERTADEVDPLFASGIALSGAGVALALTIGNVMYVVMIVGLIVMAFGANRTRQRSG